MGCDPFHFKGVVMNNKCDCGEIHKTGFFGGIDPWKLLLLLIVVGSGFISLTGIKYLWKFVASLFA